LPFANGLADGGVSLHVKENPTAEMEALLAHAGWLRRFGRALVHDTDEAEDLAQEVLVKAARRPEAKSRAWLATVARHLAVDRFRSGARLRQREQAAQRDQSVTTPEELVADAQIHRQVAEAVAGLTEPFRHTLVLRFYEGLTAAEIARRLGQPEGTIRWRVKEGLERVRRQLDQRHDGRRAAWVAALSPLLPKPVREGRAPTLRSRISPPRLFALALGAGTLTMLSFAASLMLRAGGSSAPAATPAPWPEPTAMPWRDRGVRLGRANLSIPVDDAEPPSPGPGANDARSLVEELLAAVEGNDYDAFVAKGSAGFRAAVATTTLEHLHSKMGERLAQGRRLTTLGSVRRPEHMDWLFKIEFFVWKVSFTGAPDEALVRLWAKDGKVAGVVVQ
jgi:RNA polymerase sigma-70 factor (ECF subfamily)